MTMEQNFVAAVGERRGAAAADRLCEASVAMLDVDAAALSLVYQGANIVTLGVSDALARVHAEMEFLYGEGPCVEAVARRTPVVVTDLADPRESRWPGYGPAMVSRGILSVYAIPIAVNGAYVGALHLFRTKPVAWSAEEVGGAMVAAGLAEKPIGDLFNRSFQDAADVPGSAAWNQLNTLTRAEVSQATGMLMEQLNTGASEALSRLRAHAYATGRTATEVARDIVDRRLQLEPD